MNNEDRKETILDSILAKLEGQIYETMSTVEKTLEVSSEYATEIVRDFLKEKF